MRHIVFRSFYVLALLLPASVRAQPAPENNPPLWSWFGHCARPVRMAVEVRVDGHLEQRAIVELCHLRRAAIEQRQYDARLSFRLRGGRTFQAEYATRRTDTIRGDVWQAGADPNAIILGVSFMTTRQVLLNTVYVLVPGRRGRSVLDSGITVTSYPV